MTELNISSEEEKLFCINCRFIATSSDRDWQKFRCFAPQNIKERVRNLVSGEEDLIRIHEFCKDARLPFDLACGPTGKWFEKREPPTEKRSTSVSVDDLDLDL